MEEAERRSGKEQDSDPDIVPLKESVRKWDDYEKPLTINDTHKPPPPPKSDTDDE